LYVYDAIGRELASSFVVENGSASIAVDDANAVYPVTIDPLVTSPTITFNGETSNDVFGTCVASAGDLNGDGYSDVAIGAPGFKVSGTQVGKVYVYHGSSTGLPSTATWSHNGTNVSLHGSFGSSIASADVNGDGYSDLLVGDPGYDGAKGSVFVYHGSSSGLTTASPKVASWSASLARVGAPAATFGACVASAGDVNGDGYSDIIVGAPYDQSVGGQPVGTGSFAVWHGSSSGLGSTGTWANAEWTGYMTDGQTNPYSGTTVGCAGDVNGDGYSDICVGAPSYDGGHTNEGRIAVWHGSSTGLGASGSQANADWYAEPNATNTNLGETAAGLGDFNGDGYSDLAVGAPQYDDGQTDEGGVFVWCGSGSGLGSTGTGSNMDFKATSNLTSAALGYSISSNGDVNGDGYADLLAGCPFYASGHTAEGIAVVWLGGPVSASNDAGLGTSGTITNADWSYQSDEANANAGKSVAMAGDVNGDGYSDVVVGTPNSSNTSKTSNGRAVVFHGGAYGPQTTAGWTYGVDQADLMMGFSVSSAGDVNGDGYDDVVIGAPMYDEGASTNKGKVYAFYGSSTGIPTTASWSRSIDSTKMDRFGFCVTSLGDLNADGYGDIAVGIPYFDVTTGGDEGRVYIFLGSSTGLPSTSGQLVLAGTDQLDEHYGWSVSSAGENMLTGHAGVLVGAPGYDGVPNEGTTYYDNGRVYQYEGLNGGVGNYVMWSAAYPQSWAEFGTSVACAGDVNGDGYDDVMIGAPGYDGVYSDEGLVAIFLGGSGGLSPTTVVGCHKTIRGDQSYARFGYSVACAGDVNGNAYSDIIIGAPGYDDGNTDEGCAFVYHGTASGITATGTPAGAAWKCGGTQNSAELGTSVAGAGDVNGDGYSDVIVGAPLYDDGQVNEGAAFLWVGSSTGVNADVDGTNANTTWLSQSDVAGAKSGTSVAGKCDVNADGYSDVIVGAPIFDVSAYLTDNSGRAMLFYGNASIGVPSLPRQFRTDLTTPIVPPMRCNSTSQAGFGVKGRGFIGRLKVKAEYEVKEQANAFNASSTALTSLWTNSGTAGTSLSQIISGLNTGTAETKHKFRIRLRYRCIEGGIQPFGPWRFLSTNALNEADLYSTSAPSYKLAAHNPVVADPSCTDYDYAIVTGASSITLRRHQPAEPASYSVFSVDGRLIQSGSISPHTSEQYIPLPGIIGVVFVEVVQQSCRTVHSALMMQ